jgi:hypothetical protein
VHVYPIAPNQSFKTDLRYFDSSSDGKNGDVGYRFNNNNGYAKKRARLITRPGAQRSPTPWVAVRSCSAISVSAMTAASFS